MPVGHGFKVNARNSLMGSKIIGDYMEHNLDLDTDDRVLVFERPEAPQKPKPPAKPRVRRTKAQIDNAKAQGVTTNG